MHTRLCFYGALSVTALIHLFLHDWGGMGEGEEGKDTTLCAVDAGGLEIGADGDVDDTTSAFLIVYKFQVQALYAKFPSFQRRVWDAISTAAAPQSSPWLWPLWWPRPMPARTRACSSFSAVKTPKITGTPVSSWTFIRPWDTASEMYSKCMVSPLMRTPMAMTASNAEVDAALPVTAGVRVPDSAVPRLSRSWV